MQQRCGALDFNGAQRVLHAGHAGDHALGPPPRRAWPSPRTPPRLPRKGAAQHARRHLSGLPRRHRGRPRRRRPVARGALGDARAGDDFAAHAVHLDKRPPSRQWRSRQSTTQSSVGRRSWHRDTWVLVAFTLVVAGADLWSQVQVATWCPDTVPDQAACQTRNFMAGPAYVLWPIVFFWLVYLIVWGTGRLRSLLRRPLADRGVVSNVFDTGRMRRANPRASARPKRRIPRANGVSVVCRP